MKITKKRLKAIILEEILARKAVLKAQNGQIQEDIQVRIAPTEAHLGHVEGDCGEEGCSTCGGDGADVIDLSEFEPVYEEET
jgi:hypothetical protein